MRFKSVQGAGAWPMPREAFSTLFRALEGNGENRHRACPSLQNRLYNCLNPYDCPNPHNRHCSYTRKSTHASISHLYTEKKYTKISVCLVGMMTNKAHHKSRRRRQSQRSSPGPGPWASCKICKKISATTQASTLLPGCSNAEITGPVDCN